MEGGRFFHRVGLEKEAREVPTLVKPERFRTEQEKTEETEAPKAPVTVGVVFGGSPFSECSRLLKKLVLSHFHASVLSVISAWLRLRGTKATVRWFCPVDCVADGKSQELLKFLPSICG